MDKPKGINDFIGVHPPLSAFTKKVWRLKDQRPGIERR